MFSLPQNVVWDCNFVGFDHIRGKVEVNNGVVIGIVLDEGIKVGTITGDETAVVVISVLTTGVDPTDVVTTDEVNIGDKRWSQYWWCHQRWNQRRWSHSQNGFDIAVNINDNSSKIFWARAWAMASVLVWFCMRARLCVWARESVWIWFCMRAKLCVWARESVWTLARVWA